MQGIKKIIAACPAGLGNRIKCIVATLKQCNYDINNMYVYWPINDLCGCKFKDLFKPVFNEISKDKISKSKISKDDNLNKSWKLNGLDFKYNILTQSEINKFLPEFDYIRPKQDIQDAVWAFMNKYKEIFNKKEVIGVHIRKGDYKVSFDGRQYISTDEKFIRRMDNLLNVNPNYKFLLCTEDKFTEYKFTELFGKNHIIYFPKKFRGRNTTNSIKEAFVDMLLLSKCPIIFGTFLSTFSEVAWWLGGCKAQVVIPGTENKTAVDKVWAHLPKQGEGIRKKIWRRLKIWWKEGK